MAIQETRTLPAKFVTDLGEDLAKQVTAQSGVPTVSVGLAGISQQPGEADADFQARQQAAREFTTRKQSLAGLAPTVADPDRLQGIAQTIAEQQAGVGTDQQGLGTFQPFLKKAQEAAAASAGLLDNINAQNLLGTGVDTRTAEQKAAGDPASLGSIASYMSPFQTQVINATLEEFDRNKAIQEQQIRDQQTALGALGSGRAGVQLAEFGTGAARERLLLDAGLRQQAFQQAVGARQQDIANRFGLAQAQQGLGGFQAGLGQTAGGITATNISRLGQLGALNQAQEQAEKDATREAARQATFLPQEQLDRFAGQVTGIMGGYPGQFQSTITPNPTPLQTALGLGTTLAGIYGAFSKPGQFAGNFNFGPGKA